MLSFVIGLLALIFLYTAYEAYKSELRQALRCVRPQSLRQNQRSLEYRNR